MRTSLSLLLSATLTIAANLFAQQSGPVVYVQAPPPQTAAADTPQRPDRAVRIPGGVMAGQLISRVDPVYPDTDVAGTVVLHAIIGPDGSVQQLTVIAGPPRLQSAAVNAVRQWL